MVRDLGGVSEPDLEATLNLGVGMVAVLPEAGVAEAVEVLGKRGLRAWVAGSVAAASGPDEARVRLVGAYS